MHAGARIGFGGKFVIRESSKNFAREAEGIEFPFFFLGVVIVQLTVLPLDCVYI